MKWQKLWLGAVLFLIIWAFSSAQAALTAPICRIYQIESKYYDIKTGSMGPVEYKVHFEGQFWDNTYYRSYAAAQIAMEKWITYGHCDFESRRLYGKAFKL